jgi:hypothetical protein
LISAQQQAEKKVLGIWGEAEYQPQSILNLSKNNSAGWHRFIATPTKIKHGRVYVRLIVTDKIDIRIPIANLALFPELNSYLNKSLEIRGWASRTKQKFSILVQHPSAIIFL